MGPEVVRSEKNQASGWSGTAAFICFALAGALLLATLISPHRSAAACVKASCETLSAARATH